ncbi:MAG: chromate transporter [Eubacteriales bacterium]|nr:chromate transporter [Eubacteriales bacterium]
MQRKIPLFLDLFLSFAKVGCFTFGGGYAMLSVITDACVEKKKWLSHDEMMDVTVIAESTPGPIAINCATYVGRKQAGLAGAIIATLGIVLPSFLVIYLVSLFLDDLMAYPLVANAFRGIKIGVGLLILDAGCTMLKKMQKKAQPRIIAACSFAAMLLINLFSLRFSSIALMLLAGAVSLGLFLAKGAPAQKGGAAK